MNKRNTSNNNNKTVDKSKVKELPRRQKEFARIRATEPKLKNWQVAQKVGYSGKDSNDLSRVANRLMKKPEVKLELARYDELAQSTLVEVMNYSKELGKQGTQAGASYANTAGSLANSIVDRLHGKATQPIDQTTKSVTINIDLTN